MKADQSRHEAGIGNNQTETDGRGDATRALVVVPVLKSSVSASSGDQAARLSRPGDTRLAEAVGLAEAIDLDVVHAGTVLLNAVRPATLIGSGKVDEIAGLVVSLDAGLVIVDHPLSPVQQRNLEKAWKAKVIDRTGLILEIFGRRASTKEGVLQVQLAHLNYQKGRLVRSWTHLERQRGGAGFMGGPGETQIEADRRILQDKIGRLERDLEQVRRTRHLHRAKRKKVPHPVVALVGYTNAGKSTLFNKITGASVLAEDMLFATLDPTLRRMTLPHGRMVILSDTVGFISDLPTHLVAAFRATLEEVLEADLILHVRDMSDPDNQAHCADVLRILDELGVNTPGSPSTNIIEVWNKIDLLPADAVADMIGKSAASDHVAAVSAVTGEGIDGLLALIEETLSGALLSETVVLRPRELSHMAWLYDHASVLDRRDREDGSVALDLEITQHEMAEFERRRLVG